MFFEFWDSYVLCIYEHPMYILHIHVYGYGSFWVKPSTWWELCIFHLCSCGKVYKDETYHPLKVRLQEHWKAVVWGEIQKSGMADQIWKEKRNYQSLWDKVKIIDGEEHWKRCLKEAAHMLDYVDLLSRPSVEMNTIWELIREKAKLNCL